MSGTSFPDDSLKTPLETATFHGRLRWLRKGRGLTQVQLAEALGCEQTMISSWEKQRTRPSAATLRAILRFYGISRDALLAGEGFETEAIAALEAFKGGGSASGSRLSVPLTLQPPRPGHAAAMDLALGTSSSLDLAGAVTLLSKALGEGRDVWVVVR